MEYSESTVEIPFYNAYDVRLSRREAVRAFFGKTVRTGHVSPVISFGVGVTSALVQTFSGGGGGGKRPVEVEYPDAEA